MIRLKSLLIENTDNKHIVYHGSGRLFKKFDLKKTTQGIIWFTSNKDKILKGEIGAEGSGYVYKCEVTINNPAGWKEYDKYALYQLESMGYDGVILPDDSGYDCFVFSPSQVKILNVEKASN